MEQLFVLDRFLFHLINTDWSNPVFDRIMPILRTKEVWIPFYILLAVFLWFKYAKNGLLLVVFGGLAARLSDFVSSALIKENVRRLRPCNDEQMRETVRLLVDCGSGYSFTSSHAANHFALAVFLILALGKDFKKWRIPLFFWAFFIAYAQVYVGVHYPLDVISGALLGSGTGWFFSYLFQKYRFKT